MKRLPGGVRPTSKEERAALLRRILEEAEPKPGVYRMLSGEGTVLYVGKSKRVRQRLAGYFRQKRHEKGSRILRETRSIDWTYCPSEFAALREELRLIKLFRPRFNIMQKRDAAHYAFLRVTTGLVPKLVAVRDESGKGGVYYGPFIGPRLVADAAREISDALGLRDCPDTVPMYLRDKGPVPLGLRAPDCIRHDVGKCLGPCLGACSSAEYDQQVELARAFLEGRSDELLARLRSEMERSCRLLEYERAALFRDRRDRLSQLASQLTKVKIALESLSFVYPVAGVGGDDRVYLIRRGVVRAEMPLPRTTADRIALQSLIDRIFAPKLLLEGDARTHEIEEILLMTAWFRRHPEELARTWQPP